MNSINSEHNQCDEERPEDSDWDLKNVPVLTLEQEKKLWRKIDLRIMPMLSLMYLLAFLDRSNIGNAKLEGLVTQLDLTGDKFNIALPYCLFECPSNLALKAIRPSRWLPMINFVWGVVMYPQLVGVRICLGISEAGLFPGVVYYLTFWYPRYKLQYRIGLFFGAATVAGAFSGLLAFGIGYMGGIEGLEAWSWIFLIEGLATIAIAIISVFVLVDFPETAKFLTPEERAFVLWRKKYDNSSVGEEKNFSTRHIWAAFKDWQIWLHIPVYMSIVGPLNGITLFLPFGYSTPVSQLLTVPPYVAGTITLLVFAHYADELKMRSPFILAGLTMCLIGFSINISAAPNGVKYFGTYIIVMGGYASLPGVVSWLGNNLSGQYKRGVGMPLVMCIGNLSAVASAIVYRQQDEPRFIFGHAFELMFVGIGFTFLPTLVFIYRRINAKRDAAERLAREQGEKVQYSHQELRELGDRAPDFRYTL
ncbi:MFS general substrate transporter [Suillus bovinus]|uniref:MFS general substrate transporter n=1 Tax=Suillus bovinus TaxID=48563 RepID=UPI001B869469|nr:MFS general substrate transporter [Suillus bovinus]KAG2141396.1 MFS general substrate transporter [Suillus bovinus]